MRFGVGLRFEPGLLQGFDNDGHLLALAFHSTIHFFFLFQFLGFLVSGSRAGNSKFFFLSLLYAERHGIEGRMQEKTRIKYWYMEETCKLHQRHLCAILMFCDLRRSKPCAFLWKGNKAKGEQDEEADR